MANAAFLGCNNLTGIEIPDSVIRIGGGTFWECSSLSSIKISANVKSIGVNAFSRTAYYNNSINWKSGLLYLDSFLIAANNSISSNLIIKEGTKVIADQVFLVSKYMDYSGCGIRLHSVTIPGSVVYIGDSAFYQCINLTNVTLEYGVQSIGAYAFSLCNQLTGINIPNSVVQIDSGAFENCDNLTSVTIPESVKILTGSSFSGENLTMVNVAANNPNYCSIEGVLFNKDKTTLMHYPEGKVSTQYIVPKDVTTIGFDAFNNQNLIKVVLPDNLKRISVDAFDYCPNLEDINIPKNVTYIGSSAFDVCNLTNVVIPASVNYIGRYAFCNCSNLKSITIPVGIRKIEDSTFLWCSSLTDVYYGGNKTQWENIIIGKGNDYFTNANIHYTSAEVTSISLNKTFTKLHLGQKETLTVAFTPADADDKTVKWSTTDEGVVKVNGGTLIPVAKGTATVTATTPNGKSASCQVTVLGAEYIQEMKVKTAGSTATVNLTTAQVPNGSTVYLAAYDAKGILLHMTQTQIQNNTAKGSVNVTGASSVKAFVWDGKTLRPITEAASQPLQKDK